MNDAQKCSASSTTIQEIDLETSGKVDLNDVNIGSNNKLTITCLNSSLSNSDIGTKVATALKEKVAAANNGQGIASATFNVIDSKTEDIKKVINNLDWKITKDCLADLIATQRIKVKAGDDISAKNLTLQINANSIANCVNSSTSNQKQITDLVTTIDKAVEAKNEGLLGGTNLIWIVLGGVLVLLILMKLKGGKDKKDTSTDELIKLALISNMKK